MKPENTPDPTAVLLIRPTLKIAGGDISVSLLTPDLSETELRKLEVTGSPDHEWPGLIKLVEKEMAAGYRRFIVDLREVPWMNSRGLGHLIELWKLIAASGGQAALVCEPGRVLTILKISQVDLIMKPVPNLTDALQSFEPPI